MWYDTVPPECQVKILEKGLGNANDPKSPDLHVLEPNEEWDPLTLRILYNYAKDLYVKHDGRVQLFDCFVEQDWFVAVSMHGYWARVRGKSLQMMNPVPPVLYFRMRKCVVVEIRGPSARHVNMAPCNNHKGFTIIVKDIEYCVSFGRVPKDLIDDDILRHLIHERASKVLHVDYMNEQFYDGNRAYAVWSRVTHAQQLEVLKDYAEDIVWIAPGDGNGLIHDTFPRVISTDKYPMHKAVKVGTISDTLAYALKTVDGTGLILSYLDVFMSEADWKMVEKFPGPVICIDTKIITKGGLSAIASYGTSSKNIHLQDSMVRGDVPKYDGQFSENLLSASQLQVVEINSAVLYLSRMKPLYTFLVEDHKIALLLKDLGISYQLGKGYPIVMSLEAVVKRFPNPSYYVQAGKVISSYVTIEPWLITKLDTRAVYEIDYGFSHSSIRSYGRYYLAVCPVKLVLEDVTNSGKYKIELEFEDERVKYPFLWEYGNSVITVRSPHPALIKTYYELFEYMVAHQSPGFVQILSKLEFNTEDIQDLYENWPMVMGKLRILWRMKRMKNPPFDLLIGFDISQKTGGESFESDTRKKKRIRRRKKGSGEVAISLLMSGIEPHPGPTDMEDWERVMLVFEMLHRNGYYYVFEDRIEIRYPFYYAVTYDKIGGSTIPLTVVDSALEIAAVYRGRMGEPERNCLYDMYMLPYYGKIKRSDGDEGNGPRVQEAHYELQGYQDTLWG